jgi:hypothetical protein
MKFTIPFLMGMLPLVSLAQSQSGAASGLPSIAIPKTTAVLVIQTPKQGVTFVQVMDVIPAEIRGNREALPRRQKSASGIRAAMAKA